MTTTDADTVSRTRVRRDRRAPTLRDAAPFAVVTAIGVATIPLGQDPRSWGLVLLVLAVTPAIFLAELYLPWEDLAGDLRLAPMVVGVIAIELMRELQGGTVSGYIPLFMLPIVWTALFGTVRHVVAVALAVSAAIATPFALGNGPTDGNELRRILLWAGTALFVGLSINRLVLQTKAQAAAAEHLAAALDENRRELELVVGTSRDAIIRFGADGVLTYVSPTPPEEFGWDPAELLGTCAFEHVHPDDREAIIARLHDACPGGPTSRGASRAARCGDASSSRCDGVARSSPCSRPPGRGRSARSRRAP